MEKPQQKQLLSLARSFIGTPYNYGTKPEEIPKSFNCSLFTQYLYKQIGIDLPPSTILQATVGKEISSSQKLKNGDLIFFRGNKGHYNDDLFPNKNICIGHVVMYTENNAAIHAAYGKGVIEEPLETITNSPAGQIVITRRIL